MRAFPSQRITVTCFYFFEFEFLFEARRSLDGNPEALNHVLHHLRQKCSNLAGLQRISHAVVKKGPKLDKDVANALIQDQSLFVSLQSTIPVCVHPCPWLHVGNKQIERERPHFIWDVKNRQTIIVSQLPEPPQYVCVSHTWGRWRKAEEPFLRVPGVDWLIPQNSKFDVETLPDTLEQAFRTGYIWFDLFCIPQDGSELGSIEISRQALIFKNAIGVVAWLNDVQDWNVMRKVVAWYALFYLHTNVHLQPGHSTVPDMPQPHEANYVGMEMYDWNTGNVSSVPVTDGVPVAENLKIAAPMPWFTSLWTLQEVCLRPDLVLCDKAWQPLAVGKTLVTLDALVAFDDFIGSREFANSVTRPEAEEARQTHAKSSSLPQTASSRYPRISRPPGCQDMTTLFIDTHINSVMTLNAAAVFTFGQFRKCTSRRGEAIMAVTGATDWYLDHLRRFKKPPPEDDLVLDLYPLPFVQEAARKIGPTFFTSLPTELRYLQKVVDLSTGVWRFHEDHPVPVGSLLPFNQEPGYFMAPSTPTQREQAHPSLKSWQIQQDGSVLLRQAGILQLTTDDRAEAIVHAPLYDEHEKIHYDTNLSMVEQVDLGGWLGDFSNPEVAPNYAVSLFQTPGLAQEEDIGVHTGLLLKSCGQGSDGKRLRLVKVGLFFTKAVSVRDVPAVEVDWVVL